MTISRELRAEFELTKERRNRFLSNLIKEAIINTIAEQAAPPPVAGNPSPAAQVAPPAPALDPMSNPPADATQSPEGSPQEEFTLDKMIEKLNVIRGGRSFTDPEIYGQLTTLFKGWDPGTVQTIEKTFDEIAKVVTLNAEGQQGANGINPPNPAPPQPSPQGTPPAPPASGMTAPMPPVA